MKRTTYQVPELRDENDNIIQQGAFGKNTALANSTNDGWIDYVANDLEALHDNITGSRMYVASKAKLPATGDLSAMYIAEDTGKWYLWDGTKYIETDNARKIADEAIAARDAAKACQMAAKTSETNAKTSESNAAASKSAAATSATNAANSASTAGTQANTAKAWATATTSPDNAADASSTTGKTQSAKSWAMYSKDRATASASSASAAAGSASAAKTSETNAASSKTAAATSATNAANSAKAAANSATAAANSAREQQADWNVTNTTSKAYVKNKPTNLSAIGNTPQFSLNKLSKDDNGGNPVYFLMHELVQYNPDNPTTPIREVYGFNGMVFGQPRVGNSGSQFLALVKVGLGYEYNDLYSSSGHYSPVVIKDETNNKYYWAMKIEGSYQRVYMLGAFTANPLNTAILAIDVAGSLPEGWSLVHTAKLYPFDNTHVASADKDGQGNTIATTYLKKADATASLTTKTLTATDATFTGQTSVPTANAGNSSKAIANTEYVQGELTNYLPLSGGTMTGDTLITMGNGESYVRNWSNGLYLGGTYRDNASRLVLFTNSSANGFQLEAGDGTTFKRMDGKPDGTLTWDGNNILTAANYNSYALPLSGGTLTGAINTANLTWNKLGDDASFGDYNIGGKMCIKTQTARNTGIAFFDQSDTNVGEVEVNNAFNFNKPVKENGGFLVPIGVVQAFAGSTIPTGWLLCDGSAVSRTDYAKLYAVIGTTYGSGDGSTTFSLPNLTDKFIQGNATAGTVKSAGLPNITGEFRAYSYNTGNGNGAFNSSVHTPNVLSGATDENLNWISYTFDASRSNSIYGISTTVQPPALTMRYIIKY